MLMRTAPQLMRLRAGVMAGTFFQSGDASAQFAVFPPELAVLLRHFPPFPVRLFQALLQPTALTTSGKVFRFLLRRVFLGS